MNAQTPTTYTLTIRFTAGTLLGLTSTIKGMPERLAVIGRRVGRSGHNPSPYVVVQRYRENAQVVYCHGCGGRRPADQDCQGECGHP